MTKNTWIDKNQMMIMISLTVIIDLFAAFLFVDIVKGHMKNPAVGMALSGLLCLWPVLSFHYWPVRVVDKTIILARCGFMRFGRKAVPVDEIKEIKITDCKAWDEGGKANIYSVVRVVDNRGERYRNIIFNDSIQGFKAELVRRNRYDIVNKDETQFECEKRRKPEECECLSCGEMFSVKESACPKCGWSWKV